MSERGCARCQASDDCACHSVSVLYPQNGFAAFASGELVEMVEREYNSHDDESQVQVVFIFVPRIPDPPVTIGFVGAPELKFRRSVSLSAGLSTSVTAGWGPHRFIANGLDRGERTVQRGTVRRAKREPGCADAVLASAVDGMIVVHELVRVQREARAGYVMPRAGEQDRFDHADLDRKAHTSVCPFLKDGSCTSGSERLLDVGLGR